MKRALASAALLVACTDPASNTSDDASGSTDGGPSTADGPSTQGSADSVDDDASAGPGSTNGDDSDDDDDDTAADGTTTGGEPPLECSAFVDLQLGEDCDAYDVDARSCGGGSMPAWPSIGAAIDASTPGAVVCVRAGDYDEDVVVDVPGDEGAPITIAAYPPEGCQGDIGDRRTDCNVRIAGPSARVTVAADHVVLSGFAMVAGGFEGYVLTIHDVADVTVRNCLLDGNFQGSDNQHTGGVCSGVTVVNTSYVTFERNEVLNNADDGFEMYESDHLVLRNNEVHGLHACGTDDQCVGPCFNGHSDGFEGDALDDVTFDANFVYDINSTSPFIFGTVGETSTNLTFVNNIFYGPEVGFAMYIQGAANVRMYNNVIWGRLQGAYGGFAIGPDVSALEMIDNVILSINYAHLGGSYDAAEHHSDHNVFGAAVGQFEEGPTDLVGDPGFTMIPLSDALDDFQPYSDVRPEHFRLQRDSIAKQAGTKTADTPDHDFFGNPRSDTPSIGAIE